MNSNQFQFTPLREGLRKSQRKCRCIMEISIHAPARGASITTIIRICRKRISIHAPARGASQSENTACMPWIFQFTPLREGLLASLFAAAGRYTISIHAPARGASNRCLCKRVICNNFNSRPCERGFELLGKHLGMWNISIHAPARGASTVQPKSQQNEWYFNSRPCERGFWIYICYLGWNVYFNSRPCERGFSKRFLSFFSTAISIHAPARGASAKINNFSFCLLLFFIH